MSDCGERETARFARIFTDADRAFRALQTDAVQGRRLNQCVSSSVWNLLKTRRSKTFLKFQNFLTFLAFSHFTLPVFDECSPQSAGSRHKLERRPQAACLISFGALEPAELCSPVIVERDSQCSNRGERGLPASADSSLR